MSDTLFAIRKVAQGYCGTFRAMASPCEIHLNTNDSSLVQSITKLAYNEAIRIEQKFSRYRTDNIVYTINNSPNQSVKVDSETAKLLDFAQLCYELSDGLFDITSGVLRQIWKFDGSDNIPSRKQAKALLPYIGWNKVVWKDSYITLPQSMEIDLGGIGKEYAVDLVAKLISEQTDIPFLVNFGGDLFASKPPQNQTAWHVGVENIGGSKKQAMIYLKQGGLATSGDERRYLLKEGKRYSHILNPKTAWPVSNAPHSITVASHTCLQAGLLSTLSMLKGKHAEDFLKNQNVLYWVQS